MKKLYNILIAASFGLLAAACTDDPQEPKPVLSPVSNLVAQASDEEVALSWTAPGDAEPVDYQVSYMEGATKKILYTECETSYKVSNLTNGTEYEFSVKSVYGDRLLSEAVTVKATPQSERVDVKGFTATADGEKVHLAWEKCENAIGYQLSWVAEQESAGGVTVADTTAYDVEGLTLGREYTFGICALYNRGISEIVTAKATPWLSRVPVKDLAVTAAMDGSASISWTAPAANVLAYKVVITSEGAEVSTEEIAASVTTYTAEGLADGKSYTFAVSANYTEGWSDPVEVSATVKLTKIPVTNLTAQGDNAAVILNWTAPDAEKDNPVQGYIVLNGDQTAATPAADAVSAQITDLQNDTEYSFSVIAVYATGNSEAVTVKATPTNIIPWSVSTTELIAGHDVTFTYDNTLLPATNIKWTVNGTVREGAVVTCPVEANDCKVNVNDAQNVVVTLEATVGGYSRTWSITLKVKPYMFIKNDWDASSSYNGLKYSVPVFSPDGNTLYVMSKYKPTKLYALDPVTGEQKWKFELGGLVAESSTGATVNPVTGVIYFGTHTAKHFYAVKLDGTLLWENTTDIDEMNLSSTPAVSRDGKVVYVHDYLSASKTSNVTALNAETGAKIWQVAAPAKGSGMIVNGSELVVASNIAAGAVKFLNVSDGSEIANIDLTDKCADGGNIAVSPDRKYAFVCTNTGLMTAIDLEKHTKICDLKTPAMDPTKNSPSWEVCVTSAGKIFGGTKAGSVYCMSFDGSNLKVDWVSYENGVSNAFNYGHPCCDAAGNFYITGAKATNESYIYRPDGSVAARWTELTGAGQKQMGGNAYHNGILYSTYTGASGENGSLVAKYVGGQDAVTGWPCHGGDICGSCCIK